MSEVSTFTIGGVDVLPYVQHKTLTLDKVANGRSVLRCKLNDPGETFVPDVRDEVVFALDGSTVFGGTVWDMEATMTVKAAVAGGARGYTYTLNCVDYAAFTDVVLINGIYGPADLIDMLDFITDNLALHGITLDGAQDTGPAIVAQGWEFLTTRQALDRLAQQTGWIWRISPTGELRMFDPTSVTAPTSIVDAVPGTSNEVQGLAWKKSLNGYSNVVWLRHGPEGATTIEETFTGDGVVDEFELGATFVNLPTTQTVNVVISATPAVQTLGLEADPGQWYINSALTHLVHTAGAYGSGDTVTLSYFAASPTNLQEIDATEYTAHGPFEVVVNDPNVLLNDEAQALVDGELRRRGGPYRTILMRTRIATIEPLMSLPIVNAQLDLNDDFLVTETRLRHIAQFADDDLPSGVRHEFQWDITLVEGTEVSSWLNFFDRRR
jgi:hypothetical protein